jgi:hypothetical protein
MNSFDLKNFKNKLLTEHKIVKKTTLKENYDPDVIDEIRDYFEMMIQNQPEDALELVMNLVKNDGNNWGEWIDDIQYNIVDSYGGDYDGAIRGYRETEDDDMDELDEGTLEEMAKISGDLKSSIEAVIAANPDLQGLALKKAIKSDDNVINALAGDNLYDNQLNRFISLTKGERQNQPKDRPTNPNKTATAPKEKSPKLKITKPTKTPTNLDDEDMEMEKQASTAAKSEKRLGTAAEKLAQITKEMKALAKEYSSAKGTPKEAGIVSKLKSLTAEKKALEKKTTPKQMTAADLMGDNDDL